MLKFATVFVFLSAGLAANGAELKVVSKKNVGVPMRDGTILRADVYRPDKGGPYPVLVHRTAYGKSNNYVRGKISRFVTAGYIVVSQDVRGRYASDGQWESFWRFTTHDAQDGYDTVEWAAQLDGANGTVGTFGGSRDAYMQWRLAPLQPASLRAMSASSCPARMTDHRGQGTIRPGRRLKQFITVLSPDMRRRSGRPGVTDKEEMLKRWNDGESEKWLYFLPWLDLPREVFEDDTEAVHYWLNNPHTDPWKLHEDVDQVVVPNLNVVGWFDHGHGDLMLDRAMRSDAATETARKRSCTIIGPWSHYGVGRNWGAIKFGPEANLQLARLDIQWFDYWLKTKANGVDTWAPYRIFVMGDNRWRDEMEWPLARAKERSLYLTSDGQANTPEGNGRLSNAPASVAMSDRYSYDPKNPVPTLYDEWRGETKYYTTTTDQRPLADREDILVYQSEPLAERIEVTGNPVVELHAASSAPDTDFFVRLIDVAPDGLARDVSMGMVRSRYRDGLDKPKLIEPGEVVKYTIRMNPTSNAFLPGHRIRLDITSSDFPNYDRNHNTAADQNADAALETATQIVHHGGTRSTRVVLPWIEQPK